MWNQEITILIPPRHYDYPYDLRIQIVQNVIYSQLNLRKKPCFNDEMTENTAIYLQMEVL